MFHLFDNGITTTILRINDDGLIDGIPTDPANTDYQAYLEWVAAGNTPTEWTPE